MATQGNFYYGNDDQHVYPAPPARDRTRTSPNSANTPKNQQFLYQQCRSDSPAAMMRPPYRPDEFWLVHHSNSVQQTSARNESCGTADKKSISSCVSPRTENLKRRSSLREAARSLKTSKVAKRLRRHGRADYEREDDNDAGASASESDGVKHSMYGLRTNPSPSPMTDSHRRPSAVSDLTNGLQSALTIRTNSGDSKSSTASLTSSRFMDSSDSASTRTSITTLSSFSKKSRAGEDEDFEVADDDDSDLTGRRSSQGIAPELEQPQLFACPYAKHDPHRYSAANLDELNYRGCSQSYLTDLARVKQHLYRVHERPQHHCPICFEIFKNQTQCIKHIEYRSCSARPCPFNEKMSAEQLVAIKKKNRGTDPWKGWYEIYKTLFPGTPLPLSPYAAFTATADTLESFMAFVIQELPLRLQHRSNSASLEVNGMQRALPDVLRDIRRDFNPLTHSRPESRTSNTSDSTLQGAREEGTSSEINFHHMATVEPSRHNITRPGRPPAIDLPTHNNYIFQPTPTASASVFSPQSSLELPFHEDQGQHGIPVHYPQQHLRYDVQDHSMITSDTAGPMTAILHPREGQCDYFLGQHQGHELLPAFRIETEGHWLPNMIVTTPHDPMTSHGVTGMMGGFY